MSDHRLTLQRLAVPVLLGLGIVATLGREIVFANYLGVSRDLEIFRIAFSLPNMLSQSLAPAYIGAILPVLVAVEQAGEPTKGEFLRRLARISVFGVLSISLVGALSAGAQAALLAPGFEQSEQTALAMGLVACWMFFLLAGVSFLPRLFLNNRQEFWPGSSASLVISVCLIAACLLLPLGVGASSIAVLGYATIVAGAVILLVHTLREPGWFRLFVSSFRKSSGSLEGRRHAIIGPLLFVLSLHAVNALPRFVDRGVGSTLEPGTIASLDYSFNILTVPGILLGSSLITVYFPPFVKRVKDLYRSKIGADILLPVVIALIAAALGGVLISVFAEQIVSAVYGRGAFDRDAVISTSTLLSWHGWGLGFMVTAMILSQGCLAFGAYKALLIVAALRLLSKWLAVEWLVPLYGLDGLGASFIVPELVSSVLLAGLLVLLYRRGRKN